MSEPPDYPGCEDAGELVRQARLRTRRLYGEDLELLPPSSRGPFTPVQHLIPETALFEATHRQPDVSETNIRVLRAHLPPVAFQVTPDCDCDWCRSCRARGIPGLASRNEDPFSAGIQVIRAPESPVRHAVISAYRMHLPDARAAWTAALDLMRTFYPSYSERYRRRWTLMALDLWAYDAGLADGEIPNVDGGYPCRLAPGVTLKVEEAARELAMRPDELVSRIVSAWLLGAWEI